MLYIKVIDGMAVDHPVMSENLLEVFGSIPEEYKIFNRTIQPFLGYFEEWDMEAVQYAEVDGMWTDLWPRKQVSDKKRAEITAQWKAKLSNDLVMAKQFAQEWLARDKEIMRQHWEAHIQDLDAFVIPDDVDITTVRLPDSPFAFRYDENGNKLTTEMAGSVPNVIG